jgi:probable rRNA maturation factor
MPVRVAVSQEARMPGMETGATEAIVTLAARAVLADRGVTEAQLSITLLADPGMAILNRQWKGRDEPTDVLAFALYDEGEPPFGDVYVGVDRGAEQAAAAGEPLVRELARLTIHGTLHVLGYSHEEEDRETSELWGHQERILAGLTLP